MTLTPSSHSRAPCQLLALATSLCGLCSGGTQEEEDRATPWEVHPMHTPSCPALFSASPSGCLSWGRAQPDVWGQR